MERFPLRGEHGARHDRSNESAHLLPETGFPSINRPR
jgi:hypothetical protein